MSDPLEEIRAKEAQEVMEGVAREALLRLLDILASRIVVELMREGEVARTNPRHS